MITKINKAMIKRIILNNIGIVLAILALLTVTVYAWTGPGQAPPGGNVPAPINVGDPANPNNYNQRKDGKLSIKAPIPANYDFRVGGAIKVDDAANGVSVFDRSLAIFGSAAVIGNLQVRDGLTATEAGGGGDTVEVGKDPRSPGIKMVDDGQPEGGGPYIDMVSDGAQWDVRLWHDWRNGPGFGGGNRIEILGDNPAGAKPNNNIRVLIGTIDNTAAQNARIFVVDTDAGEHPSATQWQGRSSRRWKENIRPITGALEKILKLDGVSFTWKSTKARDIGFVAEDVGKLFPEIVSYDKNGKDATGMDYGRLTAVLVEAIKEQQTQIENQAKEIEALKAAVDELKAGK